jgi:hypothetical protein
VEAVGEEVAGGDAVAAAAPMEAPGPFHEGSGGEAPSTVCLICARRGHYYSACTFNNFEDGSLLFCRVSGNDVCTVRSNETLYRLWNVKCDKVTCTHDNLRRHLCSFCSGGHHAFSWSCQKQPAY